MKPLLLSLGLSVLYVITAVAAADSTHSRLLSEPVRTADGLVTGVPGKIPAIAVFKGIPFGAPGAYERIRKSLIETPPGERVTVTVLRRGEVRGRAVIVPARS